MLGMLSLPVSTALLFAVTSGIKLTVNSTRKATTTLELDSVSQSNSCESDSEQDACNTTSFGVGCNGYFQIKYCDYNNTDMLAGCESLTEVVFPHISRVNCRLFSTLYPMVGGPQCPVQNGLYTEFQNYPAFYLPITLGGGNTAGQYLTASADYLADSETNIIAEDTTKKFNAAVNQISCYKEYDSVRPFLYNVDILGALPKNHLDSNFTTYFINVYYDYLNDYLKAQDSKSRLTYDPETGAITQTVPGQSDPVSISYIVPKTKNHYCGDAKLAELFNMIISDKANADFITKFIELLIEQFKEAVAKCTTTACSMGGCSGSSPFTTKGSYEQTYLAILNYLLASIKKCQEKPAPGPTPIATGTYLGTFAAIPYQLPAGTPPVMGNYMSFVTIENDFVDMEKVNLFIKQ